MAAPTLAQIQSGIQARLDTIPSLTGRTYAFQPESITPPCGWVWFPEIPAYHYAMNRGTVEYRFPVYVMVGSQVDYAAQLSMSGYVSTTGTESVLLAIEGDRSLGGLDLATNGATVVDFRPTNIDEANTLHAVGGVWTVQVLAVGV